MNTDIKKQYTESKVEKATHTFAYTLLYKAKAITDSAMFGKIRNNKYIKRVDNETNSLNDESLLLVFYCI